MNAKRPFRFDPGGMRELAGDKVFARGEAYFQEGQATVLAIEPERVLALVAGTQDYRVELTGRGRKIGGMCSCPAYADWGFCKHMVAAALAANAAGEGGEEAGAISRIRAHLKRHEPHALIALIIELAERDPALFRRLEIDAAVAGPSGGKDVEARLEKALEKAARIRGFVDYDDAPGWAAGVESVLDAVAGLVPAGRAESALKLAERALGGIRRAAENIDDSEGHVSFLLERAADIHLAAARASRPSPQALARFLFEQEIGAGDDSFFSAAETYADVLGAEGLAEYRRLAVAASEKLRKSAGRRAPGSPVSPEAHRLRHILDGFAERDGDLDARIALRAADLSSPYSYLQLAEFCLANKRKQEALCWAEDGLWTFADDRPDERLLFFAVGLLVAAGRKGDAEELLWTAFGKAPSVEIYQKLLKLGGGAAREKAVTLLEARLAKEKRTAWSFPADLLVRILIAERLFGKAWTLVRRHGASRGVREALALASERTHPADALAVYAGRVDELAGAGGNPAYEEAAKLVARMGRLRGAGEQAAYVEELRKRFGRRRNLMKLLE